MDSLAEQTVSCPYCGESIEVLIDLQEVGHQYIEDCQVCCKPIVFMLALDATGDVTVSVYDENESW